MNKRNTLQKELVLQAVHSMERHINADEVYDKIRGDYPSISKATVYRNLNVLAEEGKITKIEIPDGPDYYDFTVKKHFHVRCIKCGNVFDVDMSPAPDIMGSIRNIHDIQFIDFDILFKGICPECRKKEKEDS